MIDYIHLLDGLPERILVNVMSEVTPYEIERFHMKHPHYDCGQLFNQLWNNIYVDFLERKKTDMTLKSSGRSSYWEAVVGLIITCVSGQKCKLENLAPSMISYIMKIPKTVESPTLSELLSEIEHHVTHLTLKHSDITDEVVDIISTLTNLESVKFANYRSTRGFHDVILANEKIQKIDIRFGFFSKENFGTFCCLMTGQDVSYPEENPLDLLLTKNTFTPQRQAFKLYGDSIFQSKKRNTSIMNNLTEFHCYSVDLRDISRLRSFQNFLKHFKFELLSFSSNDLSDLNGCDLIRAVSELKTLRSLSITDNYLDSKSMAVLMNCRNLKSLETLNLSNNSIQSNSATDILEFLEGSTITSLDLSANDFGDATWLKTLFNMTLNLIQLDLANSLELNENFFYNILESKTITKIDLSENIVSDGFVQGFSHFLRNNTTIVEMKFFEMKFPIQEVTDALIDSKTLKSIAFNTNDISISTICEIVQKRYDSGKSSLVFDISSVKIPHLTFLYLRTIYDDNQFEHFKLCIRNREFPDPSWSSYQRLGILLAQNRLNKGVYQ